MEGKQRRLGKEPRGDEARRCQCCRIGRGKRCDLRRGQRAIGAIDQHDAEQIEHRAEHREQQVAKRRPHRLRAPLEGNDGYGREGEKLEPHI